MSNWIDRRYTFSGTDAKCYAWFPQAIASATAPAGGLALESLQTISVSVREAKSQVRRLGQRSPAGMTRAIRTVAGSMIFAVIDKHPLENLFAANKILTQGYKYGWSMDMDAITQAQYFAASNEDFYQPALVAGAMLPFNLLIRHVGEFPKITLDKSEDSEKLILHEMTEILVGIEFIDEGKVTSINDLYSEITFSFVAVDYRPLAANVTGVSTESGIMYYQDNEGNTNFENVEGNVIESPEDPEVIIDPAMFQTLPSTYESDYFKRCMGL